jgi:cyclohexadieny/prephenate dehydrogenase
MSSQQQGAQYRSDTVVVMGLGLIGGSLALALRQSGFSRRFVGYGHREASLERGVELGVIDAYTLDLDEALAAADIIVLAAPTLVAAELLATLLPRLAQAGRRPLVTDVASVKGNLQAAAERACGGQWPPHLVLGHPIAGSERSGVQAASAAFFRRHRVILTPQPGNDPVAVQRVSEMWASTGAEVLRMGVAEHDAVLAATSHLPHVLAYALVDALAGSESSEDIFRFAAGGFRDFTRIASSDPVMWRDIALRAAVASGDAAQLQDTFSRAKAARDRFAADLAARGN